MYLRVKRHAKIPWIASGALLLLASVSLAQTKGPLKVKSPPPRYPRSQPKTEPEHREPKYSEPEYRDAERPVLKRKSNREDAGAVSSGPCPAGYIAVEVADEEETRPRLTHRGGKSEPAKDRKKREPRYECVARGTTGGERVVDESGRVIEERGTPPPDWDSGDPFIEAVREKVFEFSSKLPNFVCEQLTTRSTSTTNPPKWKTRDRISADVIYVDGEERYENIRRNGKEMKGSPTASGAWSTGEFGTMMLDVFHPSSRAKFEKVRTSEVGGTVTEVYDYTVAKKNSHWRVDFGGYPVLPAYKGSVWIDPESLRVLRIEMVAVDLPGDYPLDTLEMVVEYGPVEISGRTYLLTKHSENLSCKSYTRRCSKNSIEFRNYRKFEVDSSISATDSTITFGDKPQLAKPPAAKKPPEKKEP